MLLGHGDKMLLGHGDKMLLGHGDKMLLGHGDKMLLGHGNKMLLGHGDKMLVGHGDKMLLGHGDKIDLNQCCDSVAGTIFQDSFAALFLSWVPWYHGTRVASHEHGNGPCCPLALKSPEYNSTQ